MLKPSCVKKNKNIKVEVENSGSYNSHTDIAFNMYNECPVDQPKLEKLMNDINQLSPKEHLDIYVLLRASGISKEFFSCSKKATHFDIAKLPNELKWKLILHTEMTIENSKRSKIINTASSEHQLTLDKLNDSLAHPHTDDPLITGTSETARYEKMLQLNHNTILK